MTTLESFYFGNINPSEYKQNMDTKKKLSEMVFVQFIRAATASS